MVYHDTSQVPPLPLHPYASHALGDIDRECPCAFSADDTMAGAGGTEIQLCEFSVGTCLALQSNIEVSLSLSLSWLYRRSI